MAYTTHGWHIPGSPATYEAKKRKVCHNGPRSCVKCIREVKVYFELMERESERPFHPPNMIGELVDQEDNPIKASGGTYKSRYDAMKFVLENHLAFVSDSGKLDLIETVELIRTYLDEGVNSDIQTQTTPGEGS